MESPGTPDRRFLLFRASGVTYGIALDAVRSVERTVVAPTLPSSSRHVLGFVNLRGDIAPLFDFASLAGQDSSPSTLEQTCLMIEANEKPVGLAIDETLDHPLVEEVAPIVGDELFASELQVGTERVRVVDVEKLIARFDAIGASVA